MGLHFDILAVDSDLVYERRGRIQRKAGIDPQWFHLPNAIRVPESVFSRFSNAFDQAHAEFNYHGPTEFKSEELTRLYSELATFIGAAEPGETRGETEEAIHRILALVAKAQASGQSILVFGI